MAATEKQKANLIPPKLGEVRNPKGKPPGTLSAKTVISKWLSAKEKIKNPTTGKLEEMTQLDIIVLAQLQKARAKGTDAFNALLDRVEGKPKQQIEMTQEATIVWKEERYDANQQAAGSPALSGGSDDNGAVLRGSGGGTEVDNGMLLAAEAQAEVSGDERAFGQGSTEDPEGDHA